MGKSKRHEGRPNRDQSTPQGNGHEWVREWNEDKVFKTQDGVMALVLQKSNDRFPLFRQELVELGQDGKKYSRMRVQCQGRRTGVIVVPDRTSEIVKLFEEARIHIHGVLQAAEDSFIERDQQRGQFKDKAPMGIKSLGKRDRERREQG